MSRPTTGATSRTVHAAAGALALLGAAALCAAAPAGAAPTAEAPAVEQAVRTSPLTAGVDPARYTVRDVRMSAADPVWASARIAPVGADLEPADVVLRSVAGRWEVADLGSAEVGCGIAPEPVLADLELVCGL